MACILNIESSTEVCSVALSDNGTCIFHKESLKGPNHASELPPFVREAVSFADNHAIPIEAVAISEGPGSYTGLRIGTSLAKGVCYGRNIPLIAIPTLKIVTVPILLYQELPDNALLCPMIDARRMEVYTALYDRTLHEIHSTSATIIAEGAYYDWLDKQPIYFFGNGAEKCKRIITHPNAHFLDNSSPLAKNMFPLSEKKLVENNFADTAYFEPFYLKQFVATTPKKLL